MCNPVHKAQPHIWSSLCGHCSSVVIAPWCTTFVEQTNDEPSFKDVLALEDNEFVLGSNLPKGERVRFRGSPMSYSASLIHMVNVPCSSSEKGCRPTWWQFLSLMGRFSWRHLLGTVRNLPTCHRSDGETFCVEHSLSCGRGGYFPYKMRDLTASSVGRSVR